MQVIKFTDNNQKQRKIKLDRAGRVWLSCCDNINKEKQVSYDYWQRALAYQQNIAN